MLNLKSVLVAVDFTPSSANALQQALRLAASLGAAVRVVHVVDTVVALDLERAASPAWQQVAANLLPAAHKEWAAFAAGIPGAATLPFDVSVNNRAYGILHAAFEHGVDLLVLGAFGHSRPDVGIGTVTSACIRRSPINVMVIRDTQTGPFERIVAAVDFSDTSRVALRQAASFASLTKASLKVVHIDVPPWHRVQYLSSTLQAETTANAEHRTQIEEKLRLFTDDAIREFNLPDVEVACFEKGRHRSAINQYAASVNADLVCLGTRGRSNVHDTLLGSTAEKTLQESRCSVLAVKPHPVVPPTSESATSGFPS